ncbi:4-diphosphocytidyl-2-C-methyl-D-erythritol kinase [Dehalogenimonas formicexedens]|uniref:4-diphosphocytidyl-2-C-methyl-D-erythritol kinase n=1 Tax=Dehalogenimonas formicexedens TaxID=1839801 RepID=A0A1P8F4X5_9CHLR|nr:4-(cytidine 5'-diphospho)-2-C-methyl-D-erythritol kinase [Dehalogenimonas formicexedens]APV43490.1 4-diphosphocytidyl-2-C-methyl-D-erythritol kinase [Dehalogenimonas formicexedens]
MFKLLAPAKINLALEVLGKRPDGYHDIKSIVQTIDLADVLDFDASQNLVISGDLPGWDSSKSLVSKAAVLLRERFGCKEGARVHVTKRIPLMSGLGGDSSDCAAALKGFNRLWNLGLSDPELMEIGAALGSDVPFFFIGGTAVIEGRGELVTPLKAFPSAWVVLLLPPVLPENGKTVRLYHALKPADFTSGDKTEKFVHALMEGWEIPPSLLSNAFERPSAELWPEIEEYRWRFLEAGAYRVRLSGAGPALFSLHRDRSEAERIFENLRKNRLECYLAHTTGHPG